uniref:Uncharacterized protein n=1 Tax=Ditylenchus dipsaci TaxID=166011 RepID=A0A915CWI7_9BILA
MKPTAGLSENDDDESASFLPNNDVDPREDGSAAPRGRAKKREASLLEDLPLEFVMSKYGNPMVVMEEAAAARLDSDDISKLVYYHRQDEDPKLSCNPAIMVIPSELMSYKNEPFEIYDTGPSVRRMIVFST